MCVCVQMVGLRKGKKKKKNPDIAHSNLTEEPFNCKSLSMKNPFNPLKIHSLFLVGLHCIFVISE